MKKWLVLLLLFHSTAIIANQVAMTLFTLNQVKAKQKDVERMIIRGSILYPGDVIITDTKARAKIKYTNGTLVSIEPNSSYQVSAASSQPTSLYNATLNAGSIQYSSEGKKKQGVLNTPLVALSILGTEFKASISQPPYTLNLSVNSGQVQVGNGIIVNAGQSALITSNSKVTITSTAATTRLRGDSARKVVTSNAQLVTTGAITPTITTAVLAQIASIGVTCAPP